MHIARIILLVAITFLSIVESSFSKPVVETKEIIYKSGQEKMTGFLAWPKNLKKKTPAVLVVHEWWGQTDYPRKRAKMLAELGYIAMAVDMYGNRAIADHPKDAGTFAKSVMSDAKRVSQRFMAAYNTLLEQKNVDSTQLAAIGYCFGGSVVLEMAKQGASLKGVVSFHGGLSTPTQVKKGKVKARILVLNGAADKMVTGESLNTFKKDFTDAKAKFEIVNYTGAKHGFTNPEATAHAKKYGMPIAYDSKADQQSWNRMKDFLAKVFAN